MDDIIVPELQNVDTTLIIDPDTRTIDAGSDFLLGVETDNDAERVKFQCSKIVGDNLDLSQYHIYIHYQNAKGEKGKYLCEDIEDGGENITFSWLLSQKAVLYKGQTKFLVCAKKTQEETIVWNTTLANGNVLEGLDVDEDIVQQNDDVIEQILLKLEQIEASGGSYTLPIATPTQLGGVKPVAKTDEMTQEVGVDEAGGLFTKEGDGIDEETLNQINKNTEDISKLSDSKVDLTVFKNLLEKLGYTLEDLEEIIEKLPKVYIVGNTNGITDEVYGNGTLNYVDDINKINFTDYVEFAYQGSSSLNNTYVENGVDKAKNYKIKLYSDEEKTVKSKRVFKDWFATNNFHLKCNYGDCTNFMNNMMMNFLTKSYEYLTPLPRDGARYTVDGFPILLYINDVFCGIRFWNLKQSDEVYNLTEDTDLCYQIGLHNGSSKGDNSGAFVYGNLNSGSNSGKNFADAHAEIDYYWEDRVWDKTSNHPSVLYDTIQWVSEATDEEFKANLEQYFDKEYLIHYFVLMYSLGMGDSICKNFNMLYFPDMGKWYATWWDMDFACGTGWGLGTVPYDIDVLSSTYGRSRLFTKLWENFTDECKEWYWTLRESFLTVDNILDSINNVWGNVSNDWIEQNRIAKYGESNTTFKTDGASYVKTWVTNRLNHMDTLMFIENDEPSDDPTVDESLYITNGRFHTLEFNDGVVIVQATGELKESTTATTFIDYIPVDEKEYISLLAVKRNETDTRTYFFLYAYDSDKNYLGSFHTASGYTFDGTPVSCEIVLLGDDTETQVVQEIIKVPANTSYIRVCCLDKTFMYRQFGEKLGITNDTATVQELDSSKVLANTYINDSNETLTLDSSYLYDEYLDVTDETLYVSWVFGNATTSIRYAEYDENKNFIKRSYVTEIYWNDLLASLDESTRYIKIGTGSDFHGTIDSFKIINRTQDCVKAILEIE